MHLKDLLDSLDLRLKLPQHWYSTDISDDFEEGKLVENGDIVVIEAKNSEKLRRITIDVNDGMSIITHYPDGKEIGVKYMDNKDDFEYIGKPSELYYWWKYLYILLMIYYISFDLDFLFSNHDKK